LDNICHHCGKKLAVEPMIIDDRFEDKRRYGYEIFCQTKNCEYQWWCREITEEEWNEISK
jgi:hypothetical protein